MSHLSWCEIDNFYQVQIEELESKISPDIDPTLRLLAEKSIRMHILRHTAGRIGLSEDDLAYMKIECVDRNGVFWLYDPVGGRFLVRGSKGKYPMDPIEFAPD